MLLDRDCDCHQRNSDHTVFFRDFPFETLENSLDQIKKAEKRYRNQYGNNQLHWILVIIIDLDFGKFFCHLKNFNIFNEKIVF